MNDPTKQPIDIEEQRAWLKDHRTSNGSSWSTLSKRMGIPAGTLSQFGGSGYSGDEQRLAEQVYRYRQTLVHQASIAIEAPDVPDFFDTETSNELTRLLGWGQRGRLVVAAMGPGTGKTKTAKQFTACFNNVFMSTMTPSTAGVNNMQQEVLASLGDPDAVGTPQKLSRRIRERVKDLTNPLLIIDEAQHLSEKAIEEIRSWHDATGVGIALFGNIGVMQRIEGGSRKAAFAQLYSRIGLRMLRPVPLQADCDALAVAWEVTSDKEMAFIRKVGTMPGGLRGATMMLELAWMLSASERQPINVGHMQDAWQQLSTRAIAA